MGPLSGEQKADKTALPSLLKVTSAQASLPKVSDLTPYDLGATPSFYGGPSSYGQSDTYVPRVAGNFDTQLRQLLRDQPAMIILNGPSKSGKTRSLFEAVRDTFPNAVLLAPAEGNLKTLLIHEDLKHIPGPVIIWLDDLERHLTAGVTPTWTSIVQAGQGAVPGRSVTLVATIRQDQLAKLMGSYGELDKDTDLILRSASRLTLMPTSANLAETRIAKRAYAGLELDKFGLGEQLAGAPAILEKYIADSEQDIACWGLVSACVDWARLGLLSRISETDLIDLAAVEIACMKPPSAQDFTEDDLRRAITRACQPHLASGKVAAIGRLADDNGHYSYLPFDYLVSADNGDFGSARAIPPEVWLFALEMFSKKQDSESLFLLADGAMKADEFKLASRVWVALEATGSIFAKNAVGVLKYHQGDLKAARKSWLEAANHGDRTAQFNLGLLAYQADDQEGTRSWWVKAAEKLPLAANQLGILALANKEDAEALAWFEKAAQAGDAAAKSNLGMLAYKSGDAAGAEKHYVDAAESGFVDAMNSLGEIFHERGDVQASLEWWLDAAAAGSTKAMTHLGWRMFDGGDYSAATEWWEKAWNLGESLAGFYLGLLADRQGDGVVTRRWWEEAANRGETRSMYNLAVLTHVDGFDAESRAWLIKSAEGGLDDAMIRLGQELKRENDHVSARSWWEQAAEAGSSNAMILLAVMLADQGLLDQSLEWFRRAKAHGESNAQLGESYLAAKAELLGHDDEAHELWTQAVDADSGHALYHLGLHAASSGDETEAARLWHAAAAEGSMEAHANLGGFAFSAGHLITAYYHLYIAAENGLHEVLPYLVKVCELSGDFSGMNYWNARIKANTEEASPYQ